MIRRGCRQRQFPAAKASPRRAGFSAPMALVLCATIRVLTRTERPRIPPMTAFT
jgi:hypothetical protein